MLETHPNPFATVVLTHLKTLETRKDPAQRQGWKVRLVKGLFERGLSADDVRQLDRVIDRLMALPPGRDNLFWQETHPLEKEKQMASKTDPERLAHIESLLEGIEVLLKMKFGVEGLKILPEIRQLNDVEKLRAVMRMMDTVRTPDQLRRVWESVEE